MNQLVLPQTLGNLLPDNMLDRCEGILVKKNAHVFQIGQRPYWMFFVVSGEVILERPGIQGEKVVLQRTRQGFVSEASLKTTAYHCDALAVVETQVIRLRVSELRAAMESDAGFASRWISMLNSEVRRLRLHVERLSMKSVKDRVLHLVNTEGTNGVLVAATGLKSLASELGVTHEALYRTLATLERDRILSRSAGTLTLLRPEQSTTQHQPA